MSLLFRNNATVMQNSHDVFLYFLDLLIGFFRGYISRPDISSDCFAIITMKFFYTSFSQSMFSVSKRR